jgi:hypothetical protein
VVAHLVLEQLLDELAVAELRMVEVQVQGAGDLPQALRRGLGGDLLAERLGEGAVDGDVRPGSKCTAN